MLTVDVCCGTERIYDGMQEILGNDFITLDVRKLDVELKYESRYTPIKIKINPDILADMRKLPFADKTVGAIVCDPPHLKFGLSSFMAKQYGSWSEKDTIEIMTIANQEFSRILTDHGHLFLKIMPEREDLFKKTLTNFRFFLEIPTIKRNGRAEQKQGATWHIGEKTPFISSDKNGGINE
jgi:tRNA G10  N-methylase Trm11